MFRNRPLSDPYVRWPPFVISTVIAITAALSYFMGRIPLEGAGMALAFVCFGFVGYIGLYIRPNPPYQRAITTVFAALCIGFTLLSFPDWFLIDGDVAVPRTIAAFAFGISLPLIYAVYVGLATEVAQP